MFKKLKELWRIFSGEEIKEARQEVIKFMLDRNTFVRDYVENSFSILPFIEEAYKWQDNFDDIAFIMVKGHNDAWLECSATYKPIVKKYESLIHI